MIEDFPIANGDWIGVFYADDNGDLQCAGFAIWDGETTAIPAQGDDSTTDEIDGFQADETFVWMIWDASENVIYNANATYLAGMPSQGDFVINGITGLESLTTAPAISEQVIDLPSGWSLFSTYMLTEDMDVVSMLSDIYPEIIIVKYNIGNAYLPEWNFNGIGDMLVGQGYQIKLNNASTLVVEGDYMAPEENPIILTEGWNMFGCLRSEPSDVVAVFADIVEHVVIVKNGIGSAYLPDWDFNGIGDIEPGQGYQTKLSSTQTLNYLANDQEYRLSMSPVVIDNQELRNYAHVISTGNNMTVVIEDAAWDVLPTEGAEIAAFDKAGNMIGSSTYTSPLTVVTLWGDDATTLSKDGLEVSEIVSFKVWTSDEVRDFTVAEWTEGSSYYCTDAINIASSIETSHSITDLNTIDRVLVKVINVLGQEVNLDDDSFKGTVLFHVYDDGTVEKVVK
jgi:hypothetical protein